MSKRHYSTLPRQATATAAARATRAGVESAEEFAGDSLWVRMRGARTRWKLVLAVTLVVFAATTWSGLMADPTFESSATLKIDPLGGASRTMGSYGMWWDPTITEESERAIMTSRAVAERAAKVPGCMAVALVRQRDAYRPVDSLMRSLGMAGAPCQLEVYAFAPPHGEIARTLRFGSTGRVLEVVAGEVVESRVQDFVFAEPFEDRDGDKTWDEGEGYTDTNGNGRYDPAEPYTDLNGDGRWNQAEPFTDTNGNGAWDPEEVYFDLDRNGEYSTGDPFQDANGDGAWNQAEPFVDADGNGEWDAAEPFSDVDRSGRYDAAEPFDDIDRDGERDEPEPFVDSNGDGVHETGTRIVVDGRDVRIALVSGYPDGRTFDLTLRSHDEAARWIQRRVVAKSTEKLSGVIDLGVTTSSPAAAENITNALVAAYTEYKRDLKSFEYRQKAIWLERATSELIRQISDLERSRDDHVKRNRAVLLGERAQAILAERGELLRERFELEQRIRDLEWTATDLRYERSTDGILVRLEGTGVDPRTSVVAEKITSLESERRMREQAGEKPESPALQRVASELRVLRRELRSRVDELRARRLDQLTQVINSAKVRLKQINDESVQQESVLLHLPDTKRRIGRRARLIEEKGETLAFLVRSLHEAELGMQSLRPAVTVLSPGDVPRARSGPSLVRYTVAGICVGLMLGVLLALVLEGLRRTVDSPTELDEGLNLPLLAAIPAYDSLPGRFRPRDVSEWTLIARDHPQSSLVEPYRTLRANIRFGSDLETSKSLVITSAVASEGKTVTTLNLAVVMAQAGGRVVVVDADLRRPRAHKYFGLEVQPGLTEVIEGEQEWRSVVRETTIPRLFVISAGDPHGNPGALIDRPSFTTLLDELEGEFDHVLFDCPPVLAVADPAPFLRQMDAVVLLARAGQAKVETIAGARYQIERLGGRLIGCVLNGFDARRTRGRSDGYYSYYGYHGRYGDSARETEREGTQAS